MKNKQLVPVVIIVLLIIAVGLYYFSIHTASSPSSLISTTTVETSTSTNTTETSGSAKSTTNSKSTSSTSFAPSREGVSLSASIVTGPEPLTTKFLGTFPSNLNGSYTFSLTYGDGTSAPVVASCIGKTCTVSATHTYLISGSFIPELSAITKCATTVPVAATCEHVSYVIATTPITVTGNVASATLVVTPALLKAGDTADILVKGSGSSLVVDFGDGASKSLSPMTNQIDALEHVYAAAGTYELKVTRGSQTIASQSVVVQ